MKIKRYEKKDYKIIEKWVNQIDWEPLDERLIPPTAFIAYNDKDVPVAFGSCYLGEGCSFSRLGPFLAEQEAPKKLIMKSFLMLFDKIKNEVVESGRDVIYYATTNKFMLKCAEMSGMVQAEREATAMVMSINGKVDVEFFEAYEE